MQRGGEFTYQVPNSNLDPCKIVDKKLASSIHATRIFGCPYSAKYYVVLSIYIYSYIHLFGLFAL